ncbi:MAG: TetR/AcrR family transcriptional regulator, partial [Phycisphaerales bacterium]
GDETRRRILEAAEQTPLTSGHHRVSMRVVAGAAGLRVGNLTYHFPSRELLITGMVNGLVDGYLREFEHLLSKQLLHTSAGIRPFVEGRLHDAKSERAARLPRELLVLSSQYPEVREAMGNLYADLIGRFVQHASVRYPNLTRHDLERVGCLIVILTEGTAALHGGRYSLPVAFTEVASVLVQMITRHVDTCAGPPDQPRAMASSIWKTIEV